jgi:hypothetical protein
MAKHSAGLTSWAALELLSLQPLHSDIDRFFKRENRLVAEIARCFAMYEGLVLAGTIQRERVEVGCLAESLHHPRERICHSVGYRYLGRGNA